MPTRRLVMKKTKKTLSTMTLAVSAIAMTACGNKVSTLTEYMENGKYDEAIDFYESKKFNEKESEQLTENLTELVDTLYTKYANNEISYDEIMDVFDTIDEFDLDDKDLDAQIALSMSEISLMKKSKDAYENGQTAFNNTDYTNAYQYFGQVVEADANYQSAQELIKKSIDNYKKDVDNYAEQYINTGRYDDAMAYIESVQYTIPDTDLINYFQEEIKTIEREKNIAIIDGYANNGDYNLALLAINDYVSSSGIVLSNDSELEQKYSDYEEEYLSIIRNRIDSLCNTENYLQALDVIENALYYTNAQELYDIRDHINEIRPTYLCDLTAPDANRYENIFEGSGLKDTLGNIYDPNPNLYLISTRLDKWLDDDEGYANYNLNYKYNTVKGTIAIEENTAQYGGVMCFKIFSDNVEIYSVDVNRSTAPIEISVDVSTTNWLQFRLVMGSQYEGSDGDQTYCIMSDFEFE